MSEKLCVVVPTIRPERMREFVASWLPLFDKHKVVLVTVWDGECPLLEVVRYGEVLGSCSFGPVEEDRTLFCRFTDAVRNYGFVQAARLGADYVLTLDDDCLPPPGTDPIQEHLDVLANRVPLNWLNTAHQGSPYLRGAPYGIRAEAPVMVSHGVWTGTPDFDGETQLAMESGPGGVPDTLPYYVGPVPAGVGFAVCGMNLMVRKDALPYLYFAPMGPDSGFPDLHRFADIWMGYVLARECRNHGWAMYTGGSTIVHTRASDARKNVIAEELGRAWNEQFYDMFFKPASIAGTMAIAHEENFEINDYLWSWYNKVERFADLIRGLQK